MRAVDLIRKKKEGEKHTREEIYFLVDGYVKGEVSDYQMSAWLMAVCFMGLDAQETAYLTQSFIDSGEILDFSTISNFVVDKHSTGGVGDKVSIVLIPLLAACGLTCAKLSGRGLGHTGGTVDKLESIPGFVCEISNEHFMKQISDIGLAISSQSPNLTPADGKIYSLRDVTATVDNISLICASVVSKKIASGANFIVLDVKYGSGAFIKTPDEAQELAELMIDIGKHLGRSICAVITSMDQPLGTHIGNSLEIIECIEFLKGNYEKDLYEITCEIAMPALLEAKICPNENEAKKLIDEKILSGEALNKFKEMLKAQGGNVDIVNNYSLLPLASQKVEIRAEKDGYVCCLDALKVANAAKLLGSGRDKKEDNIDFGVGIVLGAKISQKVAKGETLATLYVNDTKRLEEAKQYALDAFVISETFCKPEKLVYKTIRRSE